MNLPGGPIPVDAVRRWIGDATSRLLGDTIGISEADWRAPSLLPGWSRAHVATHVARGADDMGELATHPYRGLDHSSDTDERFLALEEGADRPGVQLQLDLDTSASIMHRLGNDVADWNIPVAVNGTTYPLATLTVMRLHEVCLHHLDLNMSCDVDAIDPDAAVWLLRWVLSRPLDTGGWAMTIQATSGTSATIGAGRVQRKVSGTDARLWAWLTGRVDADAVEGAKGVTFGLLA